MRAMTGYGLPNCLRVTIGSDAHMNLASDHLAAWCEKEKLPW
jgi:histidinol-phosphate/aromatic aminotransferase/cobyric acid decarboxylase-like protein